MVDTQETMVGAVAQWLDIEQAQWAVGAVQQLFANTVNVAIVATEAQRAKLRVWPRFAIGSSAQLANIADARAAGWFLYGLEMARYSKQ